WRRCPPPTRARRRSSQPRRRKSPSPAKWSVWILSARNSTGAGQTTAQGLSVTNAAKTRTETDTFGPIEVASDRYWGAQAQRSLGNFKIGWEKQPAPGVGGVGLGKRPAAGH